jgi:hypothetical protein
MIALQVEQYMVARLAKIDPGEDVGIYAHMLPRRGKGKAPPPLPDWVTGGSSKKTSEAATTKNDEELSDDGKDQVTEEGEEEEGFSQDETVSDDLPENGWSINRKQSKWLLCHKQAVKWMELGPPAKPSYKWSIFQQDGVDMIYQGKEAQEAADFDPISCSDFYNEMDAVERESLSGFGGKRPMPGPNLDSKNKLMNANVASLKIYCS